MGRLGCLVYFVRDNVVPEGTASRNELTLVVAPSISFWNNMMHVDSKQTFKTFIVCVYVVHLYVRVF